MTYSTVTTEGGLLPSDILDALAAAELAGQRPEDFGLERTRNLSDRISAVWQAARGQWALFQSYLADLPADETATSETREQWVLPLLRMLGYQLSRNRSAYLVEGRTFAISHRAGEAEDSPPIHVESVRNSLDARPPSGRPRLSPHALMQEYLNSTEQLWGIVTNGERLRLLRDSSRFTRPSYVEFDLRVMFEGEKFSEFALLYRLLHRSRLPHSAPQRHRGTEDGKDAAAAEALVVVRPEDCWLERYHQQALESGGRVREGLRDGVEAALKLLGNGLLQHPRNQALRDRLLRGLETGSDGDGSLTPLGYYRQLLRLVYRLLFLMVAEERGLIASEVHHRGTEAQSEEEDFETLRLHAAVLDPDSALRIYYDHYSVGRLRRLAETSGAGRGPYSDLWEGLLTTFRIFEGSDELAPRRLGLAPLDGDLFSDAACAALTSDTRLNNSALLTAVRALSLYRDKESKTLRRVNYGALDVEELGSVYESLLDYRPVVQIEDVHHKDTKDTKAEPDISELRALRASVVNFDLVAGTERKTTGSYYTRPELVQELIKSALLPVIEERLKAAESLPQRHRGTEEEKGREKVPAQSSDSLCLRASVVQQKEAALLSIRVCDPACGSGHFLLAAARRLGRELARVRAGEDQPSPAQFRRAVRDVIRQCIFGVDLNPLAVDLCKLALWIEGHNAGMPLSFLDHHIRQGNSLVGATRELVAAGIPDGAYKPVSGDDKATASSFRKRNKQERELYEREQLVQQDLFAAAPGAATDLAAELRALDAGADDSVAAVRARAARYAALRRQAHAERAKFDLWTAAFFQPLTPANARYVPTSKDLIDFDPAGEKTLMAAPLAEDIGFFHWELEFPQVFHHRGTEDTKAGESDSDLRALRAFVVQSSGFDVVLGNPPWEMINLVEREHFVDVPEIRDAPTGAARKKMIQDWRTGDARQRARIAQYDKALYRAEAESRFLNGCGRYELTAFGRLNTYSLFAEHSRDLLAPTGRAGIIVPTGIATDDSTKRFFGNLVEQQVLTRFISFENEAFIFPEVHHSFRFAAITMGGLRIKAERAHFVFFCRYFDQIEDPTRNFILTSEDFRLINPNTRTAPAFRTNQDAELTKRIYRQAPVLINENAPQRHNDIDSGNPWDVSFRQGLFNMTSDSDMFQDSPGDGLVPLYEAKLIHQFDHRFSTYSNATEANLNAGILPQLTAAQKTDPSLSVQARYWVEVDAIRERLADRWSQEWLLGFRDVCRSHDERSAIFSLIPRVGVGHKMPLLLPSDETAVYLIACLFATLNSLVFDYSARQKIGGASLGFFILKQLPVLPPDRFSAADIAYIVPRVVELVYTAWDIKAFAEDVWAEADATLRTLIYERWKANHKDTKGTKDWPHEEPSCPLCLCGEYQLHPFIWHEARRAIARAELDARIARLYGLNRDELRYILDPHDVYGPDFPGETFRVLKEKEIKQHGEYRTRRLVLEAWDREENSPQRHRDTEAGHF